jgi:hypothetical protein
LQMLDATLSRARMSQASCLLNSIAFVSLAEFQFIAFNQCNVRFYFISVGRRTDMPFILGYASAGWEHFRLEPNVAIFESAVLRSITNIRAAKTRLLPLSSNLSSPAETSLQIELRESILRDMKRIRWNLGGARGRASAMRRSAVAAAHRRRWPGRV